MDLGSKGQEWKETLPEQAMPCWGEKRRRGSLQSLSRTNLESAAKPSFEASAAFTIELAVVLGRHKFCETDAGIGDFGGICPEVLRRRDGERAAVPRREPVARSPQALAGLSDFRTSGFSPS
jgi:hypothetical protein